MSSGGDTILLGPGLTGWRRRARVTSSGMRAASSISTTRLAMSPKGVVIDLLEAPRDIWRGRRSGR